MLLRSIGLRRGVTTGGAPDPAPGPPVTAGLIAHYDAAALNLSNNAAVASWPDLSGNGNHLTQSTAVQRPVYKTGAQNGLGVVEFDGNDDHFEDFSEGQVIWGIVTGDSERTIIIVTSLIDGLSATPRFVSGNPSSPSNLGYGEVAFRSNVDSQFRIGRGASFSSPVSAGNVTNPQVLTVSYKGSSDPGIWVYQNGSLLASTSTAGGFLSDSTKTVFRRGSLGSNFKGRVCEVLVYNSILSAPDREAVEAYLSDKWGLGI